MERSCKLSNKGSRDSESTNNSNNREERNSPQSDPDNVHKVFIAGLGKTMRPKQVKRYFKYLYPSTLEFRARTTFGKGSKRRATGYGFLVLSDPEEAKKVLETKSFLYRGRYLRAEPYLEKESLKKHQDKLGQKRVFIGRIPAKLTDEDLKELLERVLGPVETCYIVRGVRASTQKQFGYAVFRSTEDAKRAFEMAELESEPGGGVMLLQKVKGKDSSGSSEQEEEQKDSNGSRSEDMKKRKNASKNSEESRKKSKSSYSKKALQSFSNESKNLAEKEHERTKKLQKDQNLQRGQKWQVGKNRGFQEPQISPKQIDKAASGGLIPTFIPKNKFSQNFHPRENYHRAATERQSLKQNATTHDQIYFNNHRTDSRAFHSKNKGLSPQKDKNRLGDYSAQPSRINNLKDITNDVFEHLQNNRVTRNQNEASFAHQNLLGSLEPQHPSLREGNTSSWVQAPRNTLLPGPAYEVNLRRQFSSQKLKWPKRAKFRFKGSSDHVTDPKGWKKGALKCLLHNRANLRFNLGHYTSMERKGYF